MEIRQKIEGIVAAETAAWRAPLPYRTPIVGYADAHDPLFAQLTDLIGSEQALPADILPAAETVVAYFVPFSSEMARLAREDSGAPDIWSDYYEGTNELLAHIAARLGAELAEDGIEVATQPPTSNYDPASLRARWSHKSAAVIAGIGTFGLNRLVVTRLGTMGRIGSVVIDRRIEPSARPEGALCLWYRDGSCAACVQNCPSGALTREGFDRFRCDAYLKEKNSLPGRHGCFRCSVGPCAIRGFA